jgi:predicted phosphoribosyltransferase
VILVDDGLATGASMRAAVQALRLRNPSHLTVAVPVAAEETCREFDQLADHVLCLVTPEPFYAVGLWYRQFPEVSDGEVRRLLNARCAMTASGEQAQAQGGRSA